MQSVKAWREKLKESKGMGRDKKPSYCKLRGLFYRGKRYCTQKEGPLKMGSNESKMGAL